MNRFLFKQQKSDIFKLGALRQMEFWPPARNACASERMLGTKRRFCAILASVYLNLRLGEKNRLWDTVILRHRSERQ